VKDRDLWARRTPYEIGIPGRAFAEQTFGAIREEAEARGIDPGDPGAFLLLGEVGRALRELQGEERGGEALQRFGALLYHAFHFHAAGEPLLLLETEASRALVEGTPAAVTVWSGALPSDAGYLQLPRHLFWSAAVGDEPAEPVDGVFWTRVPGEQVSFLVALGVRDDRPGISVMDIPPLRIADAPRWLSEPAREGGEDFRTTLPGGELDRLYSLLTAGEVLKLMARVFGSLEARPEGLGPEERAQAAEDAGAASARVTPSVLPFRRIRASGGSADDDGR